MSNHKLLPYASQLAAFTATLTIVDTLPISNGLKPYLLLDDTGLAICSQSFKPLYIHELYTTLRMRQLKQELLVQAIKINPNIVSASASVVWDLTAGLGMDACVLASYGYRVTMVEYHPLLATVLRYALDSNLLPKANMQLLYADSLDILANYQLRGIYRPDVIYLDPLFQDNKSAKSNKRMQLVQLLNSNIADNSVALLQRALDVSQTKVVVKRAIKQLPLLAIPSPSYTKVGSTIRFDIYR